MEPTMEMAAMGLDILMGISGGVVEEAKVNAANQVTAANTYAQNLVRTVNNELSMSRASTARYNQSVNNQRVLENTGSAVETAGINYRRARDSATLDDFESQIAFAEQAGAQRAQAALSGLTGGVVDLVDATTRLRKSRLQQRSDEAMKLGDFDAGQRAKQIYQTGWDSLDSSEINADVDYSVNTFSKQTYDGNLFTEAFGKSGVKGLANIAGGVASFFKPPVVDGGYSIGQGSAYALNGDGAPKRKGL